MVRHKTELAVRAIPRSASGCNPTRHYEPVITAEPQALFDHGVCSAY